MSDTATTTYEGGCHCGAVRWSLTMPTITKLAECNCSICSKTGWQMAFAPSAGFTLLQGADHLTDYQFHKHVIHHLFCDVCGIRSFGRGAGPDGQEWISVNPRCIDGFEAGDLPVDHFDGRAL
ncbi:MAG: GFA family protein [Myxococcota bacterium]